MRSSAFSIVSRNFFLAVIFITIFLSVVIYILAESKKETAKEFFAVSLKEKNIAVEVRIEEQLYMVNSGIVYKDEKVIENKESLFPLKIAYARTIAERSPILSLPSNDLGFLNKAILRLEKIKKELVEIQDNKKDKDLIDSSLYPIGFLKSLSILEESRRNFILHSNDETFKEYGNKLRETIAVYKDNLEKYANAFNIVVSEDIAEYIAGETIVERAIIIQILEDMKVVIKDTEEIFKERQSCFSHNISSCNTFDLEIPLVSKKESLKTNYVPTESTADIHLLIGQAFKRIDVDTDLLVQLNSSYCVGNLHRPQLFAVSTEETLFGKERSLFFIGDIRLIETKTYPDIEYFKYFVKNNIDYLYTSFNSFYTCPELVIDYGDIFGTLLIRNLIEESPISIYVSGEQKHTLFELEKRLVATNGITREDEALEYIFTVLTLYSPESVPKQVLETLINISLAIRDKTAGFEYYINRVAIDQEVAYMWRFRMEQAGNYSDHLTAPFLFYARSGFFSLFLGPHYSILGRLKDPVYFKHIQLISLEDQPFLFYSDLKSSVDRNKLINDIRFFTNIQELIPESELER